MGVWVNDKEVELRLTDARLAAAGAVMQCVVVRCNVATVL